MFALESFVVCDENRVLVSKDIWCVNGRKERGIRSRSSLLIHLEGQIIMSTISRHCCHARIVRALRGSVNHWNLSSPIYSSIVH